MRTGAGLTLKAWREEVARQLLAIDFVPAADVPFDATFRPLLGEPRLVKSSLPAGYTFRDRELLKDGDGQYALVIPTTGRQFVHHVGREVDVARGSAVLLRVDEPGRLGSAGRIAHYSIMIDPTKLRSRLRDADAALCRPADARLPVMALLNAYIRLIERNSLAASAEAGAVIGPHLMDLVALTLGPTVDAARHSIKASAREAMRQAVLDYMRHNADDPGLDIRDIAATHGLSVRRLHYVFEEAGCSVGEHLLAIRLDRAHDLLSSPEHCHRRIADIALEAGFSDLSSFNRRYRARFGQTPSDTRAAAARPARRQ